MRSDRRQESLYLLFEAFERPYSFYVLGAGASAGIVPMTTELRQSILKRNSSFGSFPADPCMFDDIFQRVIGDPDEYEKPFISALLRRLYPSAVHAMVIKELTPPRVIGNAHAYEIFLLIKKPSTIFSMNVDGLAARYCVGHYLLEPHGRIPTKLIHSPFWDELIDALLEFGFNAPKIPGLLLPQPEPIHITSQEAYRKAVLLFQSAAFVIFIGYSFGLFHQSFDDLETFEFFRDLLKYYPKDVLVLSPNPEFVGNAIEEATGLVRVYPLPLYWNHLCQAIKEVLSLYKCKRFLNLKSLTRLILYRHDQLKDGEP